MMQDAAQELVGQRRQSHLVALVEEQIAAPGLIPQRQVHVAAVAGQMRERLGHEGGPVAVVLGQLFDHVLEEHMAIGGGQRVGVFPVHFELTVGILVIVLVRPPTERVHRLTDLTHHVVAAHQRRLVIAGLALGVAGVRDLGAVGCQQEILALHAAMQPIAL